MSMSTNRLRTTLNESDEEKKVDRQMQFLLRLYSFILSFFLSTFFSLPSLGRTEIVLREER